jgi:hypothetical protein
MLSAHSTKNNCARQAEQVGERVLATALLYAYLGKGDEVKPLLEKYFNATDLLRIEQLFLEFIGLSFVVEPFRLLYTHFDNLIQLCNIASGATFGSGVRQQRYNFLNVLSWVREIGGEHKHIYALNKENEGKYRQGFHVANLEASLAKKDAAGDAKNPGNFGKAIATGSSTFKKARHFLKAKNIEAGTRNRLFEQVRKPKPNEDKTKLHEDRFDLIGPIRVYNSVASLLRTQAVAIVDKKINHDSEYSEAYYYAKKLINYLYKDLFAKHTVEDNPFSKLIEH